MSLFDHQPELFATFNQFYGTLWTGGVVDEATKEAGRLRNARIVDCRICRNLRFAGARTDLTEDLVDLIEDGYDETELPPRFKLAVRLTDAILAGGHVDPELGAAARREFGDEGYAELVLTIATASGFSKAAVAWGPPPTIPVTEVPTPTPVGDVTDVMR
jgi:alkylhydroperoxidase family enzyme